MSDDWLRRLRAYVVSADTTMRQMPMPMPPGTPEQWDDGPVLDTSGLYTAYNRLPDDAQEMASTSHVLCQDALQYQGLAAERALLARYVLMGQLVRKTALRDDPATQPPPRPAHEYLTLVRDDAAPANADSWAAIDRDIEDHVWTVLQRRRRARSVDDQPVVPSEPASRWSAVASWAVVASMVAAAAIALIIWQHATAPTASTTRFEPINRLVQSGDTAMVINYAEHSRDATDLHVQVVNFGPEPAETELSLGDADGRPIAADPPTVVPAHSSQHRVLRVPKGLAPAKSVDVRFSGQHKMMRVEL